MIKLQDFARNCGVTDRAIQKHLQKHAKELKGHFERKGPNGTWLDDYACEYLRGFMKQQPLVISEPSEEVEQLRKKLDNVNDAFQKYASETASVLAKATEQLALVERAESLRDDNERLKAQIDDLSAEKEKQGQDLAQAEKTAHEASEKLTERDKTIDVFVNGSWRERWKLRKELKKQNKEQDNE